jgi:hypothetical protein
MNSEVETVFVGRDPLHTALPADVQSLPGRSGHLHAGYTRMCRLLTLQGQLGAVSGWGPGALAGAVMCGLSRVCSHSLAARRIFDRRGLTGTFVFGLPGYVLAIRFVYPSIC